ncbi:hypothetical protein GRI69_01155 [Erythrobacter vulgaris]|uniref:Uncharacterized protein n=1 Tax=Qipengyuania vulgaris TaxID=291985 RepID=A0A844XP94_9SPHN|nr:hypothetical protein [Qipengyuania vulgaris]MXO46868.1 hypothetical protein [Qipengyuania vulgaris]
MARKSIDSRMDRIYGALLPIGSMARREYELPDDLRDMLAKHRTRTAAIIDRAENTEPGGAYAAMLEGTLRLPEMPAVLRDALQLSDPPVVTEDMSVREVADVWMEFAVGANGI